MVSQAIVLPVFSANQFNRGSDAAAPSTPTGLAAEAGDGEINLTWNSVADIIRYHLYYDNETGVDNTNTRIQIDSDQVSYTLTGLDNGTTYYFKIAAVGPGGESALSAEVSVAPSAFSNTKSLIFDGVDERCTWTSDNYSATTYSMWLKVDSTLAAFGRIFETPGYILLVDYVNDTVEFRAKWSGATARWAAPSSSVPTDTWNHLAISYDAGSTSNDPDIYVNNSLLTEVEVAAPSGTKTSNSGASVLGANTGLSAFYKGNIDEFSIYNTNLDASAVSDIYNGGEPIDISALPSSANLVLWWRMGDVGTISSIPDQVGSRDLTPVNMESGDIEEDVPT